MSPDSTPRELAKKTSPLLAALAGVATLLLLRALDAMHLWALAILAALLTETLSMLIIEWSVKKLLQRRVKDLSEAISQSSSAEEVRLEKQSLDDILAWANSQIADIKSLEAKDSFRKEFIGNLAHELKTPLFNIQGFILTLIESDLKDEELVRRFLEKADNNVSRMTELIDDLDTITKLESDSLALTLAPCNIIDTCKEAIDGVEAKAQKMGIDVRLELPESEMESLHVLCGPVQIRQVLTNLLVNSIHYGKEGGQSTLRLKAEGETVRITVEDNGIGISKEDLSRIYERFYRVDKSRSRHAGGSGLGLAIVKHIIEAHGQSIQVRSVLNKGTAFSFELVNLDAEAEKRNIQLDTPELG
ncbi:MAG: two-component sensor histidine kinase [Flavobacteriales bacterium]|nr:two-component sensor histidine kinase [Flavobacteriales bacterium]